MLDVLVGEAQGAQYVQPPSASTSSGLAATSPIKGMQELAMSAAKDDIKHVTTKDDQHTSVKVIQPECPESEKITKTPLGNDKLSVPSGTTEGKAAVAPKVNGDKPARSPIKPVFSAVNSPIRKPAILRSPAKPSPRKIPLRMEEPPAPPSTASIVETPSLSSKKECNAPPREPSPPIDFESMGDLASLLLAAKVAQQAEEPSPSRRRARKQQVEAPSDPFASSFAPPPAARRLLEGSGNNGGRRSATASPRRKGAAGGKRKRSPDRSTSGEDSANKRRCARPKQAGSAASSQTRGGTSSESGEVGPQRQKVETGKKAGL